MGLLDGKKAAIFGVANDRSIAWAISEAFHAEGAELAFTYAGEVLEKRVRPLAEGIGSKIILPCDVTKDEDIEKVFAKLKADGLNYGILTDLNTRPRTSYLAEIRSYPATPSAGGATPPRQRSTARQPWPTARPATSASTAWASSPTPSSPGS